MIHLTPLRFCILLIVLETAYVAIAMARAPTWDAFLIGDCPYYAATAESLVQDGDWDIRNQCEGILNEGFFALSHDKRIVPKHSVLLPILSIPFFVAFGKAGFLIFNVIQTFALIVGIMVLAGKSLAARWLALVAYLSTPFLAYTFNYSPDVLGASLLAWSFVFAIDNKPIRCGFLAGLAVWAKIYLALLLLPLVLVLMRPGWKSMLAAGLSALIALLPMLIINWHLFGSPFTTGYDRDARFTSDGFIVTEHYSRFKQPILTGLANLLFDRRIGLFPTAILWFLWPVGVVAGWRANPQARRAIIAMTLSLLLNLLFFARYDEWDASEFGNRFLFPAIAFGFALQGALWGRVIERADP
jgi:hypothetical protein